MSETSDEAVPLPTVAGGPDGERCDRCHYWDEVAFQDDTEPDQREGWCHRGLCWHLGNDANGNPNGPWPLIDAVEWCGEFRPRAGEKDADEWGRFVARCSVRLRNVLANGGVRSFEELPGKVGKLKGLGQHLSPASSWPLAGGTPANPSRPNSASP